LFKVFTQAGVIPAIFEFVLGYDDSLDLVSHTNDVPGICCWHGSA
jgi:hypothetical protein